MCSWLTLDVFNKNPVKSRFLPSLVVRLQLYIVVIWRLPFMLLFCASFSFLCETTVLELRRWGCPSTRSPFLQKSVVSSLHRGAFITRRTLQNKFIKQQVPPHPALSILWVSHFIFSSSWSTFYCILTPSLLSDFHTFLLSYFPVFKKWLLSFQLQLQGHLKHFDQRTVLQSRWLCTRWSVLKQYGALSLNPHRWTIFRFHGMQVVPYLSDLLSLGHLKERSHLFPFVSCYLFACIGINLWETWRLDFGGRCMQIFFWLFTHASCWSFLLCMIHHHLLEHISKVLEWCVHFLSF